MYIIYAIDPVHLADYLDHSDEPSILITLTILTYITYGPPRPRGQPFPLSGRPFKVSGVTSQLLNNLMV